MAIIEGIGDEVIILLTLIIIILLIGLAWVSTHVREPLFEIFIIDGSRLGNLIQRLQIRRRGRAAPVTPEGQEGQADDNNAENNTDDATANSDNTENVNTENSASVENNTSEDVNEEENNIEESTEPEEEVINASENNEQSETSDSVVNTNTETVPASQNELRQRRLNFFKVNPLNEESCSTQPLRNVETQETSIAAETATSDETTHDPAEEQAEVPTESPDAQPANEEPASSPPDGHIRVRLKYLDDRQKLVLVSPEDTVAQFKRRHFAAELAENFIIRFIFNGQELRQEATLESYNVRDNSVIHCLLSNQHNNAPRREDQEPAELDIGRWMFPLFGLILGVVWYYRIAYRNYFNAPTTLSLIGITFLYFTTLLATLRQEEEQGHR